MWEWWLKKLGTDEWSPIQTEWNGHSIILGDGVIVKGRCPGKDAGTFETMENSTGIRMFKSYPSKGFLKHMMEGF